MATAWFLWSIVLAWYVFRAVRVNPDKPNWNKAIAAAALWPFSLFMNRYK
ncbi:hypothetical protein [Spirosoma fluviale]|nr:hypothetical protein [Spirosoma fluviale]